MDPTQKNTNSDRRSGGGEEKIPMDLIKYKQINVVGGRVGAA